MRRARLALASSSFVLLLVAGCTDVAGRRLLILRQAQIVLKHSAVEDGWIGERALVEQHIEEELRDE